MGKSKIKRSSKIIFIIGLMVLFSWFANYPNEIPSASAVEEFEVLNDSVDLFSVPPQYAKLIESYDHWVETQIAGQYAPGAAIAIVKDNHILHLKGYGLRAADTGDSVDIHTVFRIASVSKGFAAVLAGILEEDGVINLEDKVSDYLPGFALKDTLNSTDLSIKNLLSHTTGLPRHAYTDLIEFGTSYDKMIEGLQDLSLIGPVGKYYSYQNVAYSLFGDIVNATCKIPYEQLLYYKVFNPIGMRNASVSYDSIVSNDNKAYPHVITRKGWKPTDISETYYNVQPAAGVNASIEDMANWLKALMGYKPGIISQSILERIYTPQVTTPRLRYRHLSPTIKKAQYGLGWRIITLGNRQLIYHGGYVNNYRAEIAFDPEEHIGIVILTNASCMIANRGIYKFFKDYSRNLKLATF